MPKGKEPSWPVQKLIFELLVIHGNHPSVIQRSLDIQITRKDICEDTPGLEWIKKTVKRLQDLPLDVLSELPPSVRKKRHDYEAIKDELDKRQMATLAGSQDPLIIEARSNHFNKICSWLERWKEQLLTIPDFFQTEDVLPKDSKYRKGSIRWQHREDGPTYVWFEIENDQVIFSSLRIHLDNEKLWRRFDELKHRLSEAITQAGQAKPGTKVNTRAARFLANQIANELEMPILKEIFPGKCPACPDY